MKIINNIIELRSILETLKAKGSIGLVPTMGALHEGHISLVKQCRAENEVVVVSIFVNPTQFNDKNDLIAYPRTEKQDADMLEKAGCDIIFLPSVEEMYPTTDDRIFDFDNLDKVMEGSSRPGHFNGVGQIVSKLFDAVLPNKSYFGEKDYQQLAIIRKMVELHGYDLDIVGCSTCRAENGLALSSRNMLLTEQQRSVAPNIYRIIKMASEMVWKSSEEAENYVVSEISKEPLMEVEYFTLADQATLSPIEDWAGCENKRGFIVVKMGKVRLIDNIKFN